MNSLMIALRNIRREATRVLSTILIMAVALAGLLIGNGFMLATYDALQEIAMRAEGHVIVLATEKAMPGGSYQQLTLADWQTVEEMAWENNAVLHVLPRARIEGMIRHAKRSAAFFGTGIDPAEEFKVHGPFLRTEGTLDPWLQQGAMAEVMLGRGLAEILAAEVGDILTLTAWGNDGKSREIAVRMAGFYQTGTPAVDDHTLMLARDSVVKLMATERISQLSIYLEDPRAAESMRQYLQARLPALDVQVWTQRAELYEKVKSQYDRIFGVMGLIIVVVVFLAITNTIALAIFQRRAEIATLAALGATPWRVYRQFILEACLVGILASLLGMLLAYLLTQAINAAAFMMPAPPGKSEGYPIYIYVSGLSYIVTSAVLTVVAMLAAWLASYRNGRVNIASALR